MKQEIQLSVDHTTCIRCSKCVRVCPAAIFVQPAPGSEVTVHHLQNCIVCGHCVAVCPTDSVRHGDFPADKVHAFRKEELPTPQQMLLLCKARRSNRGFTRRPVPSEYLDLILEAAHRAPTASNQQQIEYVLITDPQKLREVAAYTIGVFASAVKKLRNPVLAPVLRRILPDVYGNLSRLEGLISAWNEGKDVILRGATALILIHAPADNRFAGEDANLAYQNGSLMAETLGISQFYTGFVLAALRQDKDHGLAKTLGLKDRKILAGMALGVPAFSYPKYIDRKELRVTRFEQKQD